MDSTKLLESIAQLIELAQQGEIDPWDVQVIEVIDQYLSQVVPRQEMTRAAYESDLSQSGQAFLSASMLVLFKAHTLTQLESPAEDLDLSPENFLPEAEELVAARLRLPLERQLHRRRAALPPQKRQASVQELIKQLQLMAAQIQLAQETEAKVPAKTKSNSRRSEDRALAVLALELAHQENLTEVAGELEQFLNCHSQRQQSWLNLEQLVDLWTKTKSSPHISSNISLPSESSTKSEPYSKVSVFWALLLLSAQSKVELSQQEFYQEIKIRMLEPN